MLTNYIKLAFRILSRRKFFTFITLFGISFTLGILMVFLSFLQTELGSNKPLSNIDDLVLVNGLRLQYIFYDTLTNIDTIVANEGIRYDTTYEHKRRGSRQWNSDMNNQIAEQFLSDLPSVVEQAIYSTANFDVYVDGIKLQLGAVYSNPNYWNVFDHQITEGRVFDDKEMENAAQVVVMSTKTAQDYFGKTSGVLGKEILLDGKNFKVIGLYPHKGKIIPYVCPDLVMPYTIIDEDTQPTFYHGFYNVALLKKESVSAERVKDEVKHAASIIPLDHPSKPEGYNEVVLSPKTYQEMYAQGIYYEPEASKSHKIMKWILLSLLLFFILLPTLNLINLNVSRILERSSEIGVRKAFGAHQSTLIIQFIVENIVQTIIGGFIGLLLAIGLITLINQGGYLGKATLVFNFKFFLYSFIVVLIFGILSGLLPAYRMSKLQIVKALKQNKS